MKFAASPRCGELRARQPIAGAPSTMSWGTGPEAKGLDRSTKVSSTPLLDPPARGDHPTPAARAAHYT
jgi:hypothetical protein